MRRSLLWSAGLHAAVLLWAVIGLPLTRAAEPAMPAAMEVALISPEALAPERALAPPEVAEPAPVDPAPQPVPDPSPEVSRPSEAPAPPPVDRVAPVPVPIPPDQTRRADRPQPAVIPDQSIEAAPEPPRAAEAPEAAADRVVTEAVETQADPVPATRPIERPDRVALLDRPDPEAGPPEAEAEPEAPARDAVAEALAEALSDTGVPDAPAPGPLAAPLSQGERDRLRLAVGQCWNFASLSSAASRVTVVVGLDMAPDARPVPGSLRLVSWDGGDEAAARQAYETARRAILRCGRDGYDLPSDRFEQWAQVEMTFNPERMRLR